MLKFKRLCFFLILILSCSCSQQKKVVYEVPNALLWKTIETINCENITPTKVDFKNNVQKFAIGNTPSASFKTQILTKLISRKLKKLHQHKDNYSTVQHKAKKQSLNTANRDFSWLWSTLILLGVLAITLLIATSFGVVPAIISLFLMLLLLYLVLPEELGAVIGQAAIIIALNAFIQVLFSVLL
jgi:hypothetical protein